MEYERAIYHLMNRFPTGSIHVRRPQDHECFSASRRSSICVHQRPSAVENGDRARVHHRSHSISVFYPTNAKPFRISNLHRIRVTARRSIAKAAPRRNGFSLLTLDLGLYCTSRLPWQTHRFSTLFAQKHQIAGKCPKTAVIQHSKACPP